jgi:hypothetical protein
MRLSSIVCVGVVPVFFGVALAGVGPVNSSNQPGNYPAPNYFVIPDCATGFSKSGAIGSPQSGTNYSWNCSTPKIVCPSPPKPPTGKEWSTSGLTNPKAASAGVGAETFSYSCTYTLQTIIK